MPATELPHSTGGSFLAAVDAALNEFLDTHVRLVRGIHSDLSMVCEAARSAVLAGGKRLRPSFAYWGWRSVSAAGAVGEAEFIRAAASLELLHACALVHDDVIDVSHLRRGRPAAHITFAGEHSDSEWAGSAADFGSSAAILLGDLLLSWSGEMFYGAITQLPTARGSSARIQFDMMRTEMVAGQFLDVLAQTRGAFDPDEAARVMEYKTSKYTVQRPLLIGASAAGAAVETMGALRSYGVNLGEAFQLRDDLLGVFGDPSETGKPAGLDLREGKRTLLVALAMRAADPLGQRILFEGIGRPDLDNTGIARLRAVLVDSGAVEAVEERIAQRAGAAVQAVSEESIALAARTALVELATVASQRRF